MSTYCTPSDVSALNKARVPGVGNNPTYADIQTYIDLTGGEIDAVLLDKGFGVPLNTASWPEAGALVRTVNTRGAYVMMEDAAPNSQNLDRAQKAYDDAMGMLVNAKFALDADVEQARSEPRGPYVTYQPPTEVFRPEDRYCQQNPALPFFNRSIEF